MNSIVELRDDKSIILSYKRGCFFLVCSLFSNNSICDVYFGCYNRGT